MPMFLAKDVATDKFLIFYTQNTRFNTNLGWSYKRWESFFYQFCPIREKVYTSEDNIDLFFNFQVFGRL